MTNKKNINRRLFLNKTIKYGLFIGIGYPYLKSLGASASNLRIHNMPHTDTNLKEGNFPFFQFISQYDIGEYIPKDQGGKFIQMEILNTENDNSIIQKIREGILQKVYNDPIDWVKFETSELEKSVWINRFYALPSFARLYYLKKDPSYLADMMDLLNQWIEDNPVNDTSKTKYNWYDMQVAWRAINLSWCYYLGNEGLSDSDKTTIYNLQHEHARILLTDFGDQPLNEFNHQSHGALAMLYLATLFPALPNIMALKETAIRIMGHHIEHAFFKDGGNVEHMFGYYPFMAHVFRDFELLCKSNGIAPLKSNQDLLRKMSEYLTQIAQPNNTVPAINDSFEESVVTTLETLNKVIRPPWEPIAPSSQLFENSQFAVIRDNHKPNKSWYINLNPAPLIGAHAHAGRLAVNFWFNNSPFAIESGCSSYDDKRLVSWYRTTRAHNSVLIDNKQDEATSGTKLWAPKRKTNNKIAHWDINNEFQFCRMVSPDNEPTNNNVLWMRDVVLVRNDTFIVHDYFKCGEPHQFETLFHFHPGIDVEVFDGYVLLSNKTDKLVLKPINAHSKNTLKTEKNYYSDNGKSVLSTTLSIVFNGQGHINSSYIIAPFNKKEEVKHLEVSDEVLNGKYSIQIKNNEKNIDNLHFTHTLDKNITPFSLEPTKTIEP